MPAPGGRDERRWGGTGGAARCTAGTGATAARGGGTEGGRGVASRARATGGGAVGAGGTAGAVAAGAGAGWRPLTVRDRGGGARRRGAWGRTPGAGRLARSPSPAAASSPPGGAPFVGSATATSISGSGGSEVVGEEGVLASVLIS